MRRPNIVQKFRLIGIFWFLSGWPSLRLVWLNTRRLFWESLVMTTTAPGFNEHARFRLPGKHRQDATQPRCGCIPLPSAALALVAVFLFALFLS